MIKPRVSVVMSVFNEKLEWLQESIDSILQQTYKDFEFIIVFDNPDYDDGKKLLNDYSNKDSRIKILYNECNIGLTKSLNRGLAIAKGEYIVRMDADDISMAGRIEKQVAFMDKRKSIVASGTGAYKWRGNTLKRVHRRVNYKELRSMSIFDSPIYHPSAIFRREVDGSMIQYDERFKYSQDYALWNLLLNKYTISNIDVPLIKYRISDSQISTIKHNEQREYALLNQRNALDNLGIHLSDKELVLFQDLTRRPEITHSQEEEIQFIVSFIKKIRKRKDLAFSTIASHMLLIYVNRVSENNNLIMSLHKYIVLCMKARHFSIYSIMSLLKKYV